ncbi:transcriptional regulator [Clavibacter sp. VKM Ac-2872]|uniref:ArsR/SmtB family transcription factor n=1 Tax=Clavibacter sp. VKM Ac-2872 TaxID=2783812 RepID=UPI00188D3563|nr:helix-turn-helix domain-containing protein [Clavibacter sp. VKM Ac-2872]MBF4625253.1 helix-turn-helix transcriptional regulator [Clavibacter sp. VKM Ac-2872]
MSFDDRSDPRRVTGAAELRALAHPLRLAILEELTIDGPLTASQLAPRVGASPSLCSFHVRHLAAHGFVRESARPGGRARPWEVTSEGLHLGPEEVPGPGPQGRPEEDPEERRAGEVLHRVLVERWLARYGTWRETEPGYPDDWRTAAVHDQYGYWMTPAELGELRQRIEDMIRPLHRERRTDPASRPAGALPVELLLFGYPMRPSP